MSLRTADRFVEQPDDAGERVHHQPSTDEAGAVGETLRIASGG